MENESQKKNYSYGKRPLWQRIALYVGIGAMVYGAIYYLVVVLASILVSLAGWGIWESWRKKYWLHCIGIIITFLITIIISAFFYYMMRICEGLGCFVPALLFSVFVLPIAGVSFLVFLAILISLLDKRNKIFYTFLGILLIVSLLLFGIVVYTPIDR